MNPLFLLCAILRTHGYTWMTWYYTPRILWFWNVLSGISWDLEVLLAQKRSKKQRNIMNWSTILPLSTIVVPGLIRIFVRTFVFALEQLNSVGSLSKRFFGVAAMKGFFFCGTWLIFRWIKWTNTGMLSSVYSSAFFTRHYGAKQERNTGEIHGSPAGRVGTWTDGWFVLG